jgi:hypothetical protein
MAEKAWPQKKEPIVANFSKKLQVKVKVWAEEEEGQMVCGAGLPRKVDLQNQATVAQAKWICLPA